MSMVSDMTVTIRLPTRTLFEGQATRLTAMASNGAFGIWPNHIDFVTALVPSVMALHLIDGSEEFFGLDEGLFVKKGPEVVVVTRRGVRGNDLSSLEELVQVSFIQMDEEERQARSALSRLEAGIVRRFAELQRAQQ
ncbi:ATPase [Cohaesibacter celericrescens]|uniref:ATPase n=1 Tax=Cohaesibacter celericrescens TaxID=2067669 RepID=UPI0035681F08